MPDFRVRMREVSEREMTDPAGTWAMLRLPETVRDDFRELLKRVGALTGSSVEDFRGSVLVGGQVSAFELIVQSLLQLEDRDLKAFLVHGKVPK